MAGPLHGLRVVELAGIGPGPFAAMLLADLGADVVRVDRIGAASPVGADPAGDLLNRGKRSIAVDLKQPAGVQTVLGLAARAHVLTEGWRPGVAERLGVGPDAVLARNPALVYGRMTGWGQDGPLAGTAGHDVDYIAVAGALDPIGPAGGPPQIPVNLIGDFGGGSLYLVVGILAALREAERTGRGQVVDAAIVDGTAHLTTMLHAMRAVGLWEDRRGANLLDGGAPFYAVYETADARHMAVGALEPQFYAELVRRLGLDADPDLPGQFDRDRWPELRGRFAERFATRTRDEWTAHFAGGDACVSPVLTPGEATRDPHLTARGTFVERHGTVQPAPAPRFSATPAGLTTPPPLPGQHSRQILADWGVDDADALLASAAIHDATPMEVR
ncbi:CaiB/BaiF CoA-transferase family protein [Dactylosporangium sp. NPDC005572]|uniref:CaiB/BaiF CoA transferase family protein n=1 Tax=Dactylosporangium sp. NPDC005572 TaxID=3156889 RepID=UPI0033A3507A